MAKVVLFYPRLRSEAEDRRIGYLESGLHVIPLSLLAIARPLVKAGHEVVIIDQRIEEDALSRTLVEVADAVCLGVSTLSGYHLRGGIEVSRRVKEAFPELPVVWGGWHPTTLPEQTMEAPYVDIVVQGQGENAFLELVDRLEQGEDWSDVDGLVYRRGGEVRSNDPRPYDLTANIDIYPYHLIPMERYLRHQVVPPELPEEEVTTPVVIISSYGCAFNCGFCGHKVQYKRWYPLPAERVVEELTFLVREYGVDFFVFADGDPAINEGRMIRILDGIEEEKLELRWEFTARADDLIRFKDETLLRMKTLGMESIHVGLEHGVDRLLDLMNKRTTRAMNEAAAEKLARLEIPMYANIIFGIPTETREELIENVRFMIKMRSLSPENTVSYMFYLPTPRTPLFDLAIEHGFQAPRDLEEWSQFAFNLKDINVPWISNDLKRFIKALVSIYLLLAYPSAERQKLWDGRRLAPAYHLMQEWARFRIRRGYYSFPIEPVLVNWLHTRPLRMFQIGRRWITAAKRRLP